jgi:hypothetical protein
MIKIERESKTVFRKQEDEVGMYSMPLTDYTYKYKVFGLVLYAKSILDSNELNIEEKFITKKKTNKTGF